MNKLKRDGKVAVIYRNDYGAGWSTWNPNYPDIAFDAGTVQLIEEEEFDQLKTYLALKYPNAHLGNLESLSIEWLPEDTEFVITEYDGIETIVLKNDIIWMKA
jgi:hypothetical protein